MIRTKISWLSEEEGRAKLGDPPMIPKLMGMGMSVTALENDDEPRRRRSSPSTDVDELTQRLNTLYAA